MSKLCWAMCLPLAFVATPQSAAGQAVLSDYESHDAAEQAQKAALWRVAFRPSLLVLGQTVARLAGNPKVSPDTRAQAAALAQQAQALPEADARRALWKAITVQLGKPWSDGQALLGSLAVQPRKIVVSAKKASFSVDQLYPAESIPGATVSLDLLAAEATSSATPKRGKVLLHRPATRLNTRGANAIELDVSTVPDGMYIALATIALPSGETTELATQVYLVRNLDSRHAALINRLTRVSGHMAAKQTAEYPYALAKAMNAAEREVISYDFPAALMRSAAIMDALETGHDPVGNATGLQDRAYRYAETGELVPYQLYVPSAWSPDRQWPLVVALHGANLDERNMLGRANGQMQALAEQYGFIIVAPLGYRINSAYGSQRGMGSALSLDATRLSRSEVDVLTVTDLVSAEYNIDPKQTYLTGNSMGGGGTWWIGGHHAERWAAIAPVAFGGVALEDVAGLSKVPILAVVGDADELGMAARVQDAVAMLKAAGVSPGYLVVNGGTHASAFDTALPRIFDFFAQHQK